MSFRQYKMIQPTKFLKLLNLPKFPNNNNNRSWKWLRFNGKLLAHTYAITSYIMYIFSFSGGCQMVVLLGVCIYQGLLHWGQTNRHLRSAISKHHGVIFILHMAQGEVIIKHRWSSADQLSSMPSRYCNLPILSILLLVGKATIGRRIRPGLEPPSLSSCVMIG